MQNVTVIDPASETVREGATVVIRNGRIASVGSSVPATGGGRTLDATGKFLIPGLWDAHVHFMNTGPAALPLLLANGVTSVREMGGRLEWTRLWQREAAAGRLASPRIVTAGPILEARQYLDRVVRRDAELQGRLAPRVLPYRIGSLTPAEAEAAVDSLRSLQVDFAKIRSAPSREAYFAVLRAARASGIRVAGHQPDFATLAEAADSGQSSIEHRLRFPRGASAEERAHTFAALARNGTWYMPGFVGSVSSRLRTLQEMRAVLDDPRSALDPDRRYAPPCLIAWWTLQLEEDPEGRADEQTVEEVYAAYEPAFADLRAMLRAGVPLLVGTDAGSTFVYPGVSLHEELEVLVRRARIPVWDALRAATVEPARFSGLEEELGAISPGQIADFLILNADPLQDVRHTRDIFAVVQGGTVLDRARLDDLLESVLRMNTTGPLADPARCRAAT